MTGEDFEARFPDPRHHTISFYLHTWPKKPGQGLIDEKNRRGTGQRWEATVGVQGSAEDGAGPLTHLPGH